MPEEQPDRFTGTPLLKKDKEDAGVFGPLHPHLQVTKGVADGVLLGLRYEARDIDQDLSSEADRPVVR